MRSRTITTLTVVAGLALTGALLHWLESRALPQRAVAQSAPTTGVGRETTRGMPGGLRALAADIAWLRAYVSWEKRDAPATESLLELATALDPRPLYFWINGARIMAYDMPVWRIAAGGGYDLVPAAEQARIAVEQAGRALRWLDRAHAVQPSSAAIWVERANIELNCLHDAAAAAESYRRAAELPGAPYYAARLQVELWRRLGRKTEALACLVRIHPGLPRDDDAAAADVVLGRIRELERELGVPPASAYREPPQNPGPGQSQR